MSIRFFIVGCGRSGTSLLRDLLNRHTRIAIPVESLFIVDYLKAGGSGRGLDRLLDLLLAEPEIAEWGISPNRADLGQVPNVGAAIARLHEIFAESHGRDVPGQKTPRLVRDLPLLRDHFPEAHFIHVLRDPRAVVSSLIRSDVHQSTALHGARRWVRDVGAGVGFARAHPERTITVHYEDLVRDPDVTVHRILEFIGIPPSEQCDPLEDPRTEYSRFYSRIHENLGRPPTPQFIDRWRQELTTKEVRLVEHIAGPLMETTRYAREHPPLEARDIRLLSFRIQRALGVCRQASHYVRHRPRYLGYLLRRKAFLGLIKDFVADIHQ